MQIQNQRSLAALSWLRHLQTMGMYFHWILVSHSVSVKVGSCCTLCAQVDGGVEEGRGMVHFGGRYYTGHLRDPTNCEHGAIIWSDSTYNLPARYPSIAQKVLKFVVIWIRSYSQSDLDT